MDNYNPQRRRRRVSRKVLRRRQLAGLAGIALIVLIFVIIVANACSDKGEGKKAEKSTETTTAATTVETTTQTVIETTTVPVTTENPKASNVKLSTRELFLDIGEVGVSMIQSYPDAGTTEANEVWKSMDDSIASVDKYGYVTGVSQGETFIILSFSNYPDIEIEIKVHVAGGGTVSAGASTDAAGTTSSAADTTTATTSATASAAGIAVLPNSKPTV